MVRRVQYRVNILLVWLIQACSGNKTPEQMPMFNAAHIKVRIENGLLMQNGQPFTGIIYALQPNQKDTSEMVCFNHGHEHGVWKRFYPGGKLGEVRYFENGKKTGRLQGWWPNGKNKLDYQFKDGEYQGLCREWQADGRLIAAMNYEQGHESGHQLQYYSDGKVKANYIIINGRRYGLLGTKNCKNVSDSIFKK
ncbi:MAG: toxin-antitoxin system YwqK family antitoxin [Bacteroidota bacterium]